MEKRYLLARFDIEWLLMGGMVDRSYTPRDANSQEDVYRITSGHVADTCVRIFVLAGSYFARERVWNKWSVTTSDLISFFADSFFSQWEWENCIASELHRTWDSAQL